MPAPKSSSAKSRSAAKPKAATSRAAAKPKSAATRSAAKPKSTTAAKSTAAKPKSTTAAKSTAAKTTRAKSTPAKSTPARNVNNPIDLVILTRDRIQETLDEAAKRGRVTRSDANELVAELVRRGQRQSEDLAAEVERQLERGRAQIESATRKARRAEPVDRIVRTADRARRTARVGPSFPILGFDDLTAGQVTARLGELKNAELRKVRDYERKHANRKSVLEAVEKALA
jgi:polyhydroxyalkanoate synthesis regulator phasin